MPSSSSSKFWMYERCFRLVKSARTEEYEYLLTRTSSAKHERTVKIGKDKKRLKEYVLAHHTGLGLSYHLKEHHQTQEWLKKLMH